MKKTRLKEAFHQEYRVCDICESECHRQYRCRFCHKDLCEKHAQIFDYGSGDYEYYVYCDECYESGKYVFETIKMVTDSITNILDTFEENLIKKVKELINDKNTKGHNG